MAPANGGRHDFPLTAGINTQQTWTRPLRVLLSLSMVVLLVTVSGLLVGLDYQRARSAAIEDATERMRVFSDRVVDRFRILFGNTTALVGLASISDIFAQSPPTGLPRKLPFCGRQS